MSHDTDTITRVLTVGGRALRVAVREGDPGQPLLLLCNGLGASLEVLQPFVDALDPRRGVVRFDMPGIGGSPAPVVPYHLAAAAPLLSGLLDRLGCGQADVLGISWGGGVAQQLAGDDDPVVPLVNARIMHRLIPRSQLHVYHGGHLELATDPGRLAAAVEAFLDAELTAEGSNP